MFRRIAHRSIDIYVRSVLWIGLRESSQWPLAFCECHYPCFRRGKLSSAGLRCRADIHRFWNSHRWR